MLIKFSIRNFKSFRDKADLSMVASNYDKSRENENLLDSNVFNITLLKSAVVYGANASGKSKMIEAFLFMRRMVLGSSKESQKGERINVDSFQLDVETKDKSSEFEIIFIHQNEMFRYGFEVDRKEIVAEWLYHKPKTKEIELFYRDYQEFEIHERKFSKAAVLVKDKMIRENALMISVAAQFNDTTSGKVLDWFQGFKIISALEPEGYKGYTMSCLKDESKRKRILEMLQFADLGIADIRLQTLDAENLPDLIPDPVRNFIQRKSKEEKTEFVKVYTSHTIYNNNQAASETASFDLDGDESSGTNQFFALTGPILDVIENGFVLVVDELDSELHPNLVRKIVEIFNSKEFNPNNAQIIFNTHDTNLLSTDIFRRDQIWFVEKDRFGVSRLYSLADLKEVRKEANFEDNYIIGRYGAIPIINDLDSLFLKPKTQNTHGRG